jgi:hypothetical protein
MADIVAAIKLAPNDKNLRAHHAVCKEGKAKSTAKEKNAFAKFFSEGVYNEKKVAPAKIYAIPTFKQESV